MAQTDIIQKDLGLVTAYGYALAGGYQGTEEQFKIDFANLMAGRYSGSQYTSYAYNRTSSSDIDNPFVLENGNAQINYFDVGCYGNITHLSMRIELTDDTLIDTSVLSSKLSFYARMSDKIVSDDVYLKLMPQAARSGVMGVLGISRIMNNSFGNYVFPFFNLYYGDKLECRIGLRGAHELMPNTGITFESGSGCSIEGFYINQVGWRGE